MTAVDRAALQVLLPGFTGTTLPPSIAGLLADGLGGVCLFGSNTAAGLPQLARLTAEIREARPDAVVAIDEEGGDVTRLYVETGSPALGPAALGVVDDLDLTRDAGRLVGADLAAVGVTLDLAPVADVNSQPDNPVIGTRSFGADPSLVARHVVAWLTGLQESGVAACVKHFPGHGDTVADSHLSLPVVEADAALLAARELPPFVAALAAGTAAVMTSHLVVTALDASLPATLSPTVLSLLRDRYDYDGCIVTDALDMAGASAGRGIPEAAVQSLAAGADLLCLGTDTGPDLVDEARTAIVAAVAEGRLTEQGLHRSAGRIARLRRSRRPGDVAGLAERQCAAAGSSLVVQGCLPRLEEAHVVTVATTPNIAVGEIAWGLPADTVVPPGAGLAGIAPGHPLVVQVRDAHRHRVVLDDLAGLAGRDAVVVEWGWPGPDPGPLPRICTHGWSRPGLAAVTELLRGSGWRR